MKAKAAVGLKRSRRVPERDAGVSAGTGPEAGPERKRANSAEGSEEGVGAGPEAGPERKRANSAEGSEEGVGAAASAESERKGTACNEALANLELLRVVMELVGEGEFIFLAGTSKEWRTIYGDLYPALHTNLSSVVSSVECVRWAIKQGLELTEAVFKAAARHGDVRVCKVLYSKGCAWDDSVCSAALDNEQHGLSILQWLRSQDPSGRKEMCPWDGARMCGEAVRQGNLEALQWLLSEEGNALFTHSQWDDACRGGNASAVALLLRHPRTRALLEENRDGEWRCGAAWAAGKGHLEVLQLLHAEAYHLSTWDAMVVLAAVIGANSLTVLKWLRSEKVQCTWGARSCPQVATQFEQLFGMQFDISDEHFEVIQQWVQQEDEGQEGQD